MRTPTLIQLLAEIGPTLLLGLGVVPALISARKATLTGLVSNSGGDPVSGVTVQAMNLTTNQSATSKTTDTGQFTLRLDPGACRLTAKFQSFLDERDISLQAGEPATVEIVVPIGGPEIVPVGDPKKKLKL